MLIFPRIYPSAEAAAADCAKLKAQGFANAAVQERRDEAAAGQYAYTIIVDTPWAKWLCWKATTWSRTAPPSRRPS